MKIGWMTITRLLSSVDRFPQHGGKLLNEGLDQHGSWVYRQDNHFLAALCQLIPFRAGFAEYPVLSGWANVSDLPWIPFCNVIP